MFVVESDEEIVSSPDEAEDEEDGNQDGSEAAAGDDLEMSDTNSLPEDQSMNTGSNKKKTKRKRTVENYAKLLHKHNAASAQLRYYIFITCTENGVFNCYFSVTKYCANGQAK